MLARKAWIYAPRVSQSCRATSVAGERCAIAAADIGPAMWPLSTQGATMGCGVGAFPLCMATGSAGDAFQIQATILLLVPRTHCVVAEETPPALPQWILAVPLHRRRLRERGYNQALELAKPLAQTLNIPLRHDVLRRVRHTEAQTGLDAIERRRNLRAAFALREGLALPAHVAIVDDVFTTGMTLSECARVLKRAGVERVDVWALARAPMPSR